MQLQTARQREDESPREFADRCRALANEVMCKVGNPAAQRIHRENADLTILASFVAGLSGVVGEVKCLGYVLSSDGISASADKVKAVQVYPVPKNAKDIRAYFGLASFYRRLIPNFAEVAKPLTSLTRKNQPFVWRASQQEAFEGMKDRLCTSPVLAYPNFNLPFILTTDASKLTVAAVLFEVQDGAERPTAYASRQMNTAERNYSATEAEMLTLIWAGKYTYFRSYLYGKRFVVRTDHSVLTYIRNFADNSSCLLRWSLKLSDLEFVFENRPGPKIGHADALSRHVGAFTLAKTLDKESIRRDQTKDDFCIESNPGTISRKCEFFFETRRVSYISAILVASIRS